MYQTVEGDDTLKKAAKIAKIQQAHEEAVQLEMPTLQMNMAMVATIVSLGTLTALFGTVLGMIGSFQALSAGGGADSMALSAGISEALVNTASGILSSDTELGALTDTGSGVKNVDVNMKKHRSSVITSDMGVMSIQMSFFCILTLAILKRIYRF